MVRVYWNSRKAVWSVKDGRRPVWHARSVTLRDCTFKVSEAGRQRVLRTRHKSIHAWAVGQDLGRAEPDLVPLLGLVEVGYNPYRSPHFRRKDSGKRVTKARWAMLTEDGKVWVATGKESGR